MEVFDREDWLGRLSSWCNPAAFDELVDACHTVFGPFGAMIHHGTGFWRDAWIASCFANRQGAELVRLLHPEPYPDFAVVLNGIELRFEATEAMDPGRRRGDEFREDLAKESQGKSSARNHPVEDWLTAERAFEFLRTAAERKAGKEYAANCGLVIYLNDGNYGSDKEGIVRTFESATATAGRSFQSVYVLWESRCFHVWEAGVPAYQS